MASAVQHVETFDPRLHPRNRLGKFTEVLTNLPAGAQVRLPDGVRVDKLSDAVYNVDGTTATTPQAAALRALDASASNVKNPRSLANSREFKAIKHLSQDVQSEEAKHPKVSSFARRVGFETAGNLGAVGVLAGIAGMAGLFASDELPVADLEEVKSAVYPSLERKPGKQNWVDKVGGLPKYIERIAKHLHYEKGKDIGHAIAIAVNVVKKMCAAGDTNFPGKQNVKASSRAQACKAVAEWEAKKAKSKAMHASEADQITGQAYELVEAITLTDDDHRTVIEFFKAGPRHLQEVERKTYPGLTRQPDHVERVPDVERLAVLVEADAKGDLKTDAQMPTLNSVKKWCTTGIGPTGKKLSPEVRAKACAAVAIMGSKQVKSKSLAEGRARAASTALSREQEKQLTTRARVQFTMAEGFLRTLTDRKAGGSAKALALAGATALLEGKANARIRARDLGQPGSTVIEEAVGSLRRERDTLRFVLEINEAIPAGGGGQPAAQYTLSTTAAKTQSPGKREDGKGAGKPQARGGGKPNAGKPKQGQPGDQNFEKLHPRGRGGTWIKKGAGADQPQREVQQLQTRLSQLGYPAGAPDGVFGDRTDAQLRQFQADYGLKVTGAVDPATLYTLAHPPAQKPTDTVTPAEEMAARKAETQSGETPQQRSDRLSREGKVSATAAAEDKVRQEQAAKGSTGGSSSSASKGAGKSKGSGDTGVIKRGVGMEGDPNDAVRMLQTALQEFGQDLGKGGIDGRFGPDTEAAVKKLQGKYGLKEDGIVGPRTLKLVRRLARSQSDSAWSRLERGVTTQQAWVEESLQSRLTGGKHPLIEPTGLAGEALKGASMGAARFKEILHPRNRRGEWRDKPPTAKAGDYVHFSSRQTDDTRIASKSGTGRVESFHDKGMVGKTYDYYKVRGEDGKLYDVFPNAPDADEMVKTPPPFEPPFSPESVKSMSPVDRQYAMRQADNVAANLEYQRRMHADRAETALAMLGSPAGGLGGVEGALGSAERDVTAQVPLESVRAARKWAQAVARAARSASSPARSADLEAALRDADDFAATVARLEETGDRLEIVRLRARAGRLQARLEEGIFAEMLHPRNRKGQFRDVLGQLRSQAKGAAQWMGQDPPSYHAKVGEDVIVTGGRYYSGGHGKVERISLNNFGSHIYHVKTASGDVLNAFSTQISKA